MKTWKKALKWRLGGVHKRKRNFKQDWGNVVSTYISYNFLRSEFNVEIANSPPTPATDFSCSARLKSFSILSNRFILLNGTRILPAIFLATASKPGSSNSVRITHRAWRRLLSKSYRILNKTSLRLAVEGFRWILSISRCGSSCLSSSFCAISSGFLTLLSHFFLQFLIACCFLFFLWKYLLIASVT